MRRNSKPLPWKLFVPALLWMEMTPPPVCPYSAEKEDVSTLNSLIASTFGRRSTSDSRTEDIWTPSSVTEFDSGRWPLTENVTLVVAPA